MSRFSGVKIIKLLTEPLEPENNSFYLVESGGRTKFYISDSNSNLILLNESNALEPTEVAFASDQYSLTGDQSFTYTSNKGTLSFGGTDVTFDDSLISYTGTGLLSVDRVSVLNDPYGPNWQYSTEVPTKESLWEILDFVVHDIDLYGCDLAAAVADHIAGGYVPTRLRITKLCDITSDITVPSTLGIVVEGIGNGFNITTGKTLNIGLFSTELDTQVFFGGGTALLNRGAVAESNFSWWAGSTPPANCHWAIVQAFASITANLGGRLRVGDGIWKATGDYSLPNGIVLRGTGSSSDGLGSTVFQLVSGSSNTRFFKIGIGARQISVQDCCIDALENSDNPNCNPLEFYGVGEFGTTLLTASGISFDNVLFFRGKKGIWCHDFEPSLGYGRGGWEIEQVRFNNCRLLGQSEKNLRWECVNGNILFQSCNVNVRSGVDAFDMYRCGAVTWINSLVLGELTGSCSGGLPSTNNGECCYRFTLAHGEVNIIAHQDEAMRYGLITSALPGSINLIGDLFQSLIHFNSGGRSIINIYGGDYYAKSITSDVGAGGRIFCHGNVNVFNTTVCGVSDPTRTLCDFVGTGSIHATHYSGETDRITYQLPTTVLLPAQWDGSAGLVTGLTLCYSTASSVTQNLLRIGRADSSGVPDFYYDFTRNHPDGRFHVTGNQVGPSYTGFCGWDFNGDQSALSFHGAILTPPIITSDQNDYFFLDAGTGLADSTNNNVQYQNIRLRSSSNVNITGWAANLVAGSNLPNYAVGGSYHVLINTNRLEDGGGSITLKYNSTLSRAGNRFLMPNSADIIIPPYGRAEIIYDDVNHAWRAWASNPYTDKMARDAVGAMVDSTLIYTASTPLLSRAALTGDVTAPSGSNTTTIANAVVTLAKIANASASSKILGSGSSGSGASYVELTVGSGLNVSGTTLSATGGLTIGNSVSGGGASRALYEDGSQNLAASTNFTFDGATVSIAGSTATSTLRVGTNEIQGYALNNTWYGENIYNDGNFRARATGYTEQLRMLNGAFYFESSGSTTAGAIVTQLNVMTLQQNGKVGINITDFGTAAAQLHVISTGEQFRLGYDAANYCTIIIGSTGIVTFDAVGASSSFVFSDSISASNLSGTNTGDLTRSGENYLTLTGQSLIANAVNLSGTNVTGILAAARHPALTGDITTPSGSVATTIGANKVTLGMMATLAANSIIGNNTGSAVTPIALSASQTRTLLSLVIGTDVEAHDATLTALAGANWAANSLPIGSGTDTVSQVTFAANTFPARSSSGNLVAKTITDFGLSLVDDADAHTARTTLGILTAVRLSNLTINNSSTLTDLGVSVNVAANIDYEIRFHCICQIAVKAVKIAFAGTATEFVFYGAWNGKMSASTTFEELVLFTSTTTFTPTTLDISGTHYLAYEYVGYANFSGAGTLKLQVAQTAADVSDTSIFYGATLIATPIS